MAGQSAFGILIVTVMNGFAGSFILNVSENFSNILAGHIFIEGVKKTLDGDTVKLITDESVLMDAVDELEVPCRYIARRSEFRGTLFFQGESVSQSIVDAEWGEENVWFYDPESRKFEKSTLRDNVQDSDA